MFLFNVAQPITLILLLAATCLLIFLAQEIKKSYIAAIPLFTFLIMLIIHVVQLASLAEAFKYLASTISICVVVDFVFIFISFFGYLWVDDIEAKATGKKSIDNSLDWFWKNV